MSQALTNLKAITLCSMLGLSLIGCTTSSTPKNTAEKVQVTINSVSPEGIGTKIGSITFQDTKQGLSIQSKLSNLPSGPHGFHIHEKGSCAPAEKDGKMAAALAAGGHFNPQQSGHGTPNNGHMGDLPLLHVDSTGHVNNTVIAPRLKLQDIKGLAVMIHAGGDNYSDHPKPLGGGGDRIACGIIQ